MGTTHLDALQVAGVPTMGVNPLPLANQYWFVSSLIGANSFTGDSYTTPFGTLAFAASSTNNPKLAVGDCIVVMEGHTETVTAAGGITLNTVGLYVIGLGNGSYRPTFTFATPATTSLLVSAAGTTIANIVGLGSVNTLTKPFDIQAASCTLGSAQYGWVEWQDPSSSLQAQRVVLTNASADKLTVNLKVIGITSGGTAPVHVVQMIGVDSAILNLDCYGRASTATVNFTDTASTNVEIYGYIYNASNSASSFAKDIVDTVSGTTWFASISDGFVGYDLSGGSGSALGPAQAATVIADLAVPSTDSTANLLERDVIGSKADTSVQAISATASIAGYVKGLTDAVAGTAGLATFPAAAAAANAVSLAEVIRYISELQVPRVAIKIIATASSALTTGLSPVTLFTVTGDVIVRVWATVQTGLTSTATTGTLEIGVTGNTAGLLPQVVANGTNFPTGAVWVDVTPTLKSEAFTAANTNWAPIAGSANVICTIATNSMTAGAITFYCQYLPVSSGASVVAA